MKLFDQFNVFMMKKLRYYTDEDTANQHAIETIQPLNLEDNGFSTEYESIRSATHFAL